MRREEKDLFSIVIPTRNEGELLDLTLDSILKETVYPSYEILVVDDGSTDGSCKRWLSADGPVRVIRSGGLGVTGARNFGAENARGEYLVFLDAHCRVSPNWLAGFRRALASSGAAVVGPCFTRLWEPEPRGAGYYWPDYTLEMAWFLPRETREPYEVPLTTGACQAFRASTFHAIGRYEKGFTPWGYEDSEICLRSWLLGFRVLVDPTVTVAHYFRESRNYSVNDREIVYNFLRMIHLHFSPKRIRRVLRAVGANPDVEPAMDRLYRSDVFHVRAALQAARIRDDDWFFSAVAPEPRALH